MKKIVFILAFLFSFAAKSQVPESLVQYCAAQKCITTLTVSGDINKFDYILFVSNYLPYNAQHTSKGSYTASFQGTQNTDYYWQTGLGFIPLTSSGYINTGFNPATATNYSQNDCHLGIYFRSNKKENAIDMGCYNGSNTGAFFAAQYGDGNTYTRLNANTSAVHSAIITDNIGYITAERSNSTQEKVYKNGTLLSTVSNTSTSVPSYTMYAGACNSNGSVLAPALKNIAIVTAGKSGVNNSTVVNAFNQYLADIGYPVNIVYGFGDSFMYGTNATSQNYSWFDVTCQYRHFDFSNNGVAGQALSCGGTQSCFSTTNIPTKSALNANYKFIVDWELNDAYMIYYSNPGVITVSTCTTALQSFLTSFSSHGWSPSNDLFYAKDWKVGTNAYYTQSQLNTLSAAMDVVLDANSVPHTTSANLIVYNLAADSVHPKDNTAHQQIANQVIPLLPTTWNIKH